MPEWTDAELYRLQQLAASGLSDQDIARRLGRGALEIAARRTIVEQRARGPEPTFGPDEEGDVIPPGEADDHNAWVHVER